MKISALILLGIFSFLINANGQISQIEGYLELYHAEDTTSTYIGKRVARNIEPPTPSPDLGRWNTMIGHESGSSASDVTYSTFLGGGSGQNLSSGSYNTFLGARAGSKTETGRRNVYVGSLTGFQNVAGSSNTFIGQSAGNLIEGSNNICIGSQSGPFEPIGNDPIQASNRLYINVGPSNNPLIYGEFENDLLRVNGDLHIGRTDEGANTDTNTRIYMQGPSDQYYEMARKSSVDGTLVLGVASGPGRLNLRASGSTYMTISPSGNVGLGVNSIVADEKLHVHGSVKIEEALKLKPLRESDMATCDNDSAGTIYFDTIADALRFCNGSSWRTVITQ